MSFETFVSGLTALFELFDRTPSDPLIELYWQALGSQMSETQFSAACAKASRACKYMPKPAELLEFAGIGGKLDMSAKKAQAWEAVETAMRLHDYTTPVDFGTLVNACVRNMGGWVRLCDRSVQELVWERKRFEELYEAFSLQPFHAINGEPLTGAFPGTPVRVAIGGVVPENRKQIGSERLNVVRELADAKSRET